MEQLQKEIKEIYNLLGDETSKYIFENRLMYSFTQNKKFIRNIVCTRQEGKWVYNKLRESKKAKGIFGAGMLGRQLVRTYDDIEFKCFIDNNRAGQICDGLPIFSLEEFIIKYPKSTIIISPKLYHEEIIQQLIENGIAIEDILNIGAEYERLSRLQYFDLPQLFEMHFPEEVFVDGGCYDGRNSLEFTKKFPWGGVIAWEPDPANCQKCIETFTNNRIEYELIPKGLWSEASRFRFRQDSTSSLIDNKGNIIVDVDSIDSLISKPVSFIKMDVEGAEYQALLGARNTISRYRPRLAICVYHKLEDIWKLPCLIHSINSQYVLYLRHYSFSGTETVLYAV